MFSLSRVKEKMPAKKKITIQEIEQKIESIYLLEDKGVLRITYSAVISNRRFIKDKSVWLLLLAGSSSGKTAILQTLDTTGKWLVPVDTLTVNTFASGLQRTEEVSLLNKAKNGVIVFKDFTTITSMNEEALREIMGQMRAIYDGSFDKKTGNGQDVHWVGKVGMVGGGTMAVQRKMRQFSEQGERFINYRIKQPNSIDMTRRAMINQKDLKEKEEELNKMVAEFINQVVEDPEPIDTTISPEVQEEIVQVSDFCTLARSPVILDKKTGKVVWVPEREMPARVAIQLVNLAKSMMLMCDEHTLTDFNASILYKCAMDSIPSDRLAILRILTKYASASTKNIAIDLNYPTEPVHSWVSQLNALKMVERVAKGDGISDTWVLKKEYRDIMSRFENIQKTETMLTPSQEKIERYAQEEPRMTEGDDTLLDGIDFDDTF